MGRLKEFKRCDLLESAAEVFWRKGYADTSLSDLEEATGVKKSGLYSEFKDKDELFVCTLRYYIEEIDTLDQLAEEPLGFDNIVKFFSCAQECQEQKGCFVGISMRESAILPAEANQLIKQHFAELKKGLVKNLTAEGFGNSAKLYADMIETFFLGLSLDPNLSTQPQIETKVQGFLEMIRLQRKAIESQL